MRLAGYTYMQTLHHDRPFRGSTLDEPHHSKVRGVSERSLWIGFYIALAVLGAIGVMVGLLQRSPTGETLPLPPPPPALP
jgi:hypothetical protein